MAQKTSSTRTFPNLKKDIPIKVYEAYRTPNRLDQKILPPHNNQNIKCTEQRKLKAKRKRPTNK